MSATSELSVKLTILARHLDGALDCALRVREQVSDDLLQCLRHARWDVKTARRELPTQPEPTAQDQLSEAARYLLSVAQNSNPVASSSSSDGATGPSEEDNVEGKKRELPLDLPGGTQFRDRLITLCQALPAPRVGQTGRPPIDPRSGAFWLVARVTEGSSGRDLADELGQHQSTMYGWAKKPPARKTLRALLDLTADGAMAEDEVEVFFEVRAGSREASSRQRKWLRCRFTASADLVVVRVHAVEPTDKLGDSDGGPIEEALWKMFPGRLRTCDLLSQTSETYARLISYNIKRLTARASRNARNAKKSHRSKSKKSKPTELPDGEQDAGPRSNFPSSRSVPSDPAVSLPATTASTAKATSTSLSLRQRPSAAKRSGPAPPRNHKDASPRTETPKRPKRRKRNDALVPGEKTANQDEKANRAIAQSRAKAFSDAGKTSPKVVPIPDEIWEQVVQARKVLDQLSGPEARALELFHVDGMSLEKVGKKLKVTAAEAEQMVDRALGQAREASRALGHDPDYFMF